MQLVSSAATRHVEGQDPWLTACVRAAGRGRGGGGESGDRGQGYEGCEEVREFLGGGGRRGAMWSWAGRR
jgi:hypothetical protein